MLSPGGHHRPWSVPHRALAGRETLPMWETGEMQPGVLWIHTCPQTGAVRGPGAGWSCPTARASRTLSPGSALGGKEQVGSSRPSLEGPWGPAVSLPLEHRPWFSGFWPLEHHPWFSGSAPPKSPQVGQGRQKAQQ